MVVNLWSNEYLKKCNLRQKSLGHLPENGTCNIHCAYKWTTVLPFQVLYPPSLITVLLHIQGNISTEKSNIVLGEGDMYGILDLQRKKVRASQTFCPRLMHGKFWIVKYHQRLVVYGLISQKGFSDFWMQKIYNCLKRSFTRDADKHTSRGVASIFPWGGLKYRFQNFCKCNLGEYQCPLAWVFRGEWALSQITYIHIYIHTLFIYTR